MEAKKEASIGNVRLKLRHKHAPGSGQSAHVKLRVQACTAHSIYYRIVALRLGMMSSSRMSAQVQGCLRTSATLCTLRCMPPGR